MDYIDATIKMEIKEDGNPKFKIVLPPIVEWTCYLDASNIAVIRKDVQYWDEVEDFWKFKDVVRDSGSPSPFNAPYIRGANKHDADYVFDEDKSVKWNRNAVIEYNKTVDSIQAKNKKFQKDVANIFNICATACIKYVFTCSCLKTFEISQDEIDYIIAKAKEHDYDYPYELVDRIESYCDFYLELLKKRESNA